MTCFFLGPAPGGGVALAAIQFILIGAAARVLFLTLAILGLAHTRAGQSAVPRFLFFGGQCPQHHA